MSDFYTQMMATLGVAPGLSLYIVETDEGLSIIHRNSWAIMASSLDEAEALFREDAPTEKWVWYTATIYPLNHPAPDSPRMLEWDIPNARHIVNEHVAEYDENDDDDEDDDDDYEDDDDDF